ncbi:MAG TPA: hypothetical protein PLB79_09710 [Thermotogota bacterium]|jgi:hypothetical protein|nr:hypothetical protein [Thermotogota bacterium]HOX66083.1 hypothetical protein [Thermotogota bacterium]HPG99125.1 hypothetical protein [Thermotogota bacterium]HPV96115.1 hypothetical protein [Thermotogota bacterium]
MKNQPIVFRFLWVGAIALAAICIPIVSIRLFLALAAGVLFALQFRKLSPLIIVFLVIAALIIGIGNVIPRFLPLPVWGFGSDLFRNFAYENSYRYNPEVKSSDYSKLIKADTTVNGAPVVIVRVPGVKISFDKDSDKISFPSLLKARTSGSQLTLEAGNFPQDSAAEIVIGSKTPLDRLSLDVSFSEISADEGVFTVKRLEIRTNYLSFDGALVCDDINVTTNALDWRGSFEAKEARMQSNAASIFVTVRGMENLVLTAQVVYGEIKYLDRWEGSRKARITGTFGSVTFMKPKDSTGKLELQNSSQMVSLQIQEY